jgi:SAM-dependent methyltransferase
VIARMRHYLPLLGFVLPTLIIGYGFVIPRSCIRGVNELTIGFGTTILGAVLTYIAGVRTASRTTCPPRRPWRRRLEHYVNRQAASPHGPFGRMLARLWMFEHRRVNLATVDLLQIEPAHKVLELGCGPGWALREASARATAGLVLGLDVSSTSLLVARRTNRSQINRGLVSLRQVNGEDLDVEAATFDRVLSVHSIYFWKDPDRVISQLAEALRTEGQLAFAFRPDALDVPGRFRDDVYRFYSPAEVEKMLVAAGLTNVRTLRRPDVNPDLVWVVAKKARNEN